MEEMFTPKRDGESKDPRVNTLGIPHSSKSIEEKRFRRTIDEVQMQNERYMGSEMNIVSYSFLNHSSGGT